MSLVKHTLYRRHTKLHRYKGSKVLFFFKFFELKIKCFSKYFYRRLYILASVKGCKKGETKLPPLLYLYRRMSKGVAKGFYKRGFPFHISHSPLFQFSTHANAHEFLFPIFRRRRSSLSSTFPFQRRHLQMPSRSASSSTPPSCLLYSVVCIGKYIYMLFFA